MTVNKFSLSPPQIAAPTSPSGSASIGTELLVENALAQALPMTDIVFGGGVLVLIIMFHAFWIRFITGAFFKRGQAVRKRASMWRADLLFALATISLLSLHLAEIMLWTAALIFGSIVGDWARAAYFAANCLLQRAGLTVFTAECLAHDATDHRHFRHLHVCVDGQHAGGFCGPLQRPACGLAGAATVALTRVRALRQTRKRLFSRGRLWYR